MATQGNSSRPTLCLEVAAEQLVERRRLLAERVQFSCPQRRQVAALHAVQQMADELVGVLLAAVNEVLTDH